MLSVFYFCFLCLFGVPCHFFAALRFLGSLFEKCFGSELLFLGVGVGLVLCDGVLPRFLLYGFGGSLPKLFGKILLMSGLVFLGSFSLH